ncbi:hypothetical protein [Saccharibacter floricola]|uniref:Uncharacterized protein n=1 Tax=Saccharibacter floricola DSM 15669 TaxID=1123227 RepID=A0ABQ0NYY2_9PROT|nr:hypothetical protein [Saccharibacter floricola]GBQ06958.1 hypothetical protein AA15669_1167 [Saccharibacter floricola DSM 15669]
MTAKTTRRTKTQPPSNKPTKERIAKDDYETFGKKRLKLNTVKALHRAGDIGGEEVTAARRWLEDFVFADYGYADYTQEPLDKDYIRGNLHTFTISRSHASARIGEVQDVLGLCAHIRLKMLLVDELSFSAMGRELYPQKGKTEANAHARAQCALLLEQLAGFYLEKHREKLRARRATIASQAKHGSS